MRVLKELLKSFLYGLPVLLMAFIIAMVFSLETIKVLVALLFIFSGTIFIGFGIRQFFKRESLF